MFNWNVSDTLQYLKPFYSDLCKIELYEIKPFDTLCVCKNMFTNHVFNIYAKTGFSIK